MLVDTNSKSICRNTSPIKCAARRETDALVDAKERVDRAIKEHKQPWVKDLRLILSVGRAVCVFLGYFLQSLYMYIFL